MDSVHGSEEAEGEKSVKTGQRKEEKDNHTHESRRLKGKINKERT